MGASGTCTHTQSHAKSHIDSHTQTHSHSFPQPHDTVSHAHTHSHTIRSRCKRCLPPLLASVSQDISTVSSARSSMGWAAGWFSRSDGQQYHYTQHTPRHASHHAAHHAPGLPPHPQACQGLRASQKPHGHLTHSQPSLRHSPTSSSSVTGVTLILPHSRATCSTHTHVTCAARRPTSTGTPGVTHLVHSPHQSTLAPVQPKPPLHLLPLPSLWGTSRPEVGGGTDGTRFGLHSLLHIRDLPGIRAPLRPVGPKGTWASLPIPLCKLRSRGSQEGAGRKEWGFPGFRDLWPASLLSAPHSCILWVLGKTQVPGVWKRD